MIKHTDGYFDGNKQKHFYQSWQPETQPAKAALLIVHGLSEHCGRYDNLVNYFVPKGYAMYGLDHVGHGKSEGKRVYVEGLDDFTDNIKIYFDMIRQQQPDIPIFIVGHSMGGLISTLYLIAHQDELMGAVISAPAIKASQKLSPLTISLGNLISDVWPTFPLAQLKAGSVSRDPAVVQAYVDDPLVYSGKITARLGASLISGMERAKAEAHTITLPILILQGSEDTIVDPAGAEILYNEVSSNDKQIKIYDGLYHEIFNEPEHLQVLGDVEVWLAAHL